MRKSEAQNNLERKISPFKDAKTFLRIIYFEEAGGRGLLQVRQDADNKGSCPCWLPLAAGAPQSIRQARGRRGDHAVHEASGALEEDDACLKMSLMGCHVGRRASLFCVAAGTGTRQMEGSERQANRCRSGKEKLSEPSDRGEES